jgi:hypothetical protein
MKVAAAEVVRTVRPVTTDGNRARATIAVISGLR